MTAYIPFIERRAFCVAAVLYRMVFRHALMMLMFVKLFSRLGYILEHFS